MLVATVRNESAVGSPGPFERKREYEMASKMSGRKAKPGAGANAGRRMIEKVALRDLETKDGRKIRGGKWSRDNGSVSSSTSTS